jgi:hypothetical protein
VVSDLAVHFKTNMLRFEPKQQNGTLPSCQQWLVQVATLTASVQRRGCTQTHPVWLATYLGLEKWTRFEYCRALLGTVYYCLPATVRPPGRSWVLPSGKKGTYIDKFEIQSFNYLTGLPIGKQEASISETSGRLISVLLYPEERICYVHGRMFLTLCYYKKLI